MNGITSGLPRKCGSKVGVAARQVNATPNSTTDSKSAWMKIRGNEGFGGDFSGIHELVNTLLTIYRDHGTVFKSREGYIGRVSEVQSALRAIWSLALRGENLKEIIKGQSSK